VDVVEEFVREPLGALVEIEAGAPWQQTEVLRYDRYVPERRLGAWLRPETSTLLRQTGMHLEATYRVPLDGVAALLYRDGNDFQGLHSDRELRWLEDTRIAIVVLGHRRPFVFRPRGSWTQATAERVPPGFGTDDIVLTPGEGDLLVMGGGGRRVAVAQTPRRPTTTGGSSPTARPDHRHAAGR
jgi:alkylated DNA repair dioxygenase AlkB